MRKKKLVWYAGAENDLLRLKQWIARQAPRTAAAFIRRLRNEVNELRYWPYRGGLIGEDNDYELRQIHVRDFRIIYHYDGTTVSVVKVVHGSKPLGPEDFQE